jgi:MIP family channel proteins
MNNCLKFKRNIQPLLRKFLRVENETARQLLGEFLGTFILCLVGLSSVAQFKFNGKTDFLQVHIAFGLGAAIAVIAVGKISGAHLNPAVSLAFFLTGRLSLLKFLIYFIGQFIGAFVAAAAVFLLYWDAINANGGTNSMDMAGIFATYPFEKLSVFGGFFDQFLATAVLVILVMAVSDRDNEHLSLGTIAFLVGSAIIAIGCAFAFNAGYAINPARDLAPRLFTLIAGWGTQTFSTGQYFFWIPIVAPMVGSAFGVLIYLTLVSNNWP